MKNVRWIVLGALLASAGCGDDGSGLDGDKQINSLSQSEFDMLCMEVGSDLEGVITDEKVCEIEAVTVAATTGGTTESCESGIQDCLSRSGDAGGGAGDFTDVECPTVEGDPEISMCEATVDEARACQSAQIDALRSALDGISCDDISGSAQAVTQLGAAFGDNPECETFNNKCPGVLDVDPMN